jgi:aryl-alcohol dehydrogenase-like predicted oxidoreductase
LRRLGVERVDLYYIHRRDASVPIEDLAGFLGGLVAEGKIGGYGLSEVSPATLRRAHAEFPCQAVQSEYSLWTRLPELGMVQACAELGVAFVPFSPLARGVLSEDSPDPGVMAKDDYRLQIPRFSAENYPRNLAAVAGFKTYARDHGWTVSALALAWLLHRGDHIVPIPGTRSAEHLADWAGAPAIRLSAAQMAEIGALLPPGFAHGDRYSDDQMRTVERYC